MSKANLDEIIHSPLRLQICAILSPLQYLEFPTLREELEISDSVLSKHLKRLETVGYVKQRKGSENGRKRSWVYLTKEGRAAFSRHVRELEKLLSTTLEVVAL